REAIERVVELVDRQAIARIRRARRHLGGLPKEEATPPTAREEALHAADRDRDEPRADGARVVQAVDPLGRVEERLLDHAALLAPHAGHVAAIAVVLATLVLGLGEAGVWDPVELHGAELARRVAAHVFGAPAPSSDDPTPTLDAPFAGELPVVSAALGFR